MNKHAKNLRALPTLLPKEIDRVYLDTIREAAAELDNLAVDAARYRWLRSRDLASIDKGGIFVGQTPENFVMNGDDLDKAIDLAIVKEAQGNT